MKQISKVLLLTSMLSCNSRPIVVEKQVRNANVTTSNASAAAQQQILLKSINQDKVFTRAINEIKSSDLIIEEFETKM
tara:strand:+ start:641 stop:874 length:234 start_codon:yes stop_codon:yes gene_type:complete